MTRLLLRQADPQEGGVLFGGVDVRHIPLETLHSRVSVVFQDVYLFDDTVMGNIRMARPETSDAEVAEAARTAQCLEFIERLPQGWNTRLGDIGGRLSGGERQRISIARALLKNAPIVVLDEPPRRSIPKAKWPYSAPSMHWCAIRPSSSSRTGFPPLQAPTRFW